MPDWMSTCWVPSNLSLNIMSAVWTRAITFWFKWRIYELTTIILVPKDSEDGGWYSRSAYRAPRVAVRQHTTRKGVHPECECEKCRREQQKHPLLWTQEQGMVSFRYKKSLLQFLRRNMQVISWTVLRLVFKLEKIFVQSPCSPSKKEIISIKCSAEDQQANHMF